MLIKEVIDPMRAAYKTHWDTQYKLFPEEDKVFGSDKIRSSVKKAFTDSGMKIPSDINALLEEKGSQISLKSIRTIRDSLNDLGRIESGVATGFERNFRLAGKEMGCRKLLGRPPFSQATIGEIASPFGLYAKQKIHPTTITVCNASLHDSTLLVQLPNPIKKT